MASRAAKLAATFVTTQAPAASKATSGTGVRKMALVVPARGQNAKQKAGKSLNEIYTGAEGRFERHVTSSSVLHLYPNKNGICRRLTTRAIPPHPKQR